jgi:hypothetical protein
LLGAGLSPAWGAPSVADILGFRPRQQGVAISTPTEAEQKDCKVELVKARTGSGWVLKDGAGNILRRFYDSNGDNRIDVWSFYKDGVEVYREIDTTFNGKPDQYRWLNAGGSKWGIDQDKDGVIDTWKVISPEEVSQEVLRALVNKNPAALQALLITEAEIKSLELPADQVTALQEAHKNFNAKFQAAVAKLNRLGPKAVWLHLEIPAPQCLPADQTGSRSDIFRIARGTVLVEIDKANEWFQTGPMIQVGTAWRLVEAPTAGAVSEEGPNPGGPGGKRLDLDQDPRLQQLIEQLSAHDKTQVPAATGPNAAAVRYHLTRADILEKIVAAVKPADREPWIRQVADSLSSAAQVSTPADKAPFTRLAALEKQLVEAVPGSALAAYVAFRGLQADYSLKLASASGGDKFNEVQKEWMEKLTKFAQAYPKVDDTPDAMLQLGMVCEFLSKDVEAKNWYTQLARNFADKPQGAKAQGAIHRLEMEGKVMQLAGTQLSDPSAAFNLEQLRGRIVIIYYWASWNGQSNTDFARLKALLDGNKDLALVAVNLDGNVEDARAYLKSNPAPGVHLYQAGGLDGKLAVDYGVMVLPNLFLIGKDGKVLSRNVQVSTVEEEIKKQTKK